MMMPDLHMLEALTVSVFLTLFPMMPQEKRKWQTEMENKKRQLEDDRRALQHLKVSQTDRLLTVQCQSWCRFSSRSWTLECSNQRSTGLGHIADREDRWSERGLKEVGGLT